MVFQKSNHEIALDCRSKFNRGHIFFAPRIPCSHASCFSIGIGTHGYRVHDYSLHHLSAGPLQGFLILRNKFIP